MTVSLRLLAAALLLALPLTACTTLPDSGAVHTSTQAPPGADQAPYFAPPGPRHDDSPEQVVTGFLTAMQANPPGAEVARRFLAHDVRDTWNPSLGTIIYEAAPVVARGAMVRVRFGDVQRLDARGGWIAAPAGRTSTLRLRVVRDDGQWRIANPPDALIVPASYFGSLFVPYDLYYFDRSGQVLVPQRIYLPSGEQTATNLVRRLLLGPGGGLASVTHTAFPAGTVLELGVVVGDTGTAEVPLSGQVLHLSGPELAEAMSQLARTLRQVPGIQRVRVTVGGTPVSVGGGDSISVAYGSAQDPSAQVSHAAPLAYEGGRLVVVGRHGPEPVAGPFGRRGFALRSFAVDEDQRLVAGVAATGHELFLAGLRKGGRVRSVARGADLARPAYDMFGNLWLLDRTPAGARFVLVEQHGATWRARPVRLPGLSGEPVTAFTVTHDGTRLVAVLAGTTPRLLAAPILRNRAGTVEGGAPARRVVLPDEDLGPALDVAQVDPTTIGVLTRPATGHDAVVYAELDGAPGGPDVFPPVLVRERATELVAGPVPGMTLRAVTRDHQLIRLSGDQWLTDKVPTVLSAAYPR